MVSKKFNVIYIKKVVFLLLFLFPALSTAYTKTDLDNLRGTNPSYKDVNDYVIEKSKEHKIPPIIMKIILSLEDHWKQFENDGSVKTNVNKDKDTGIITSIDVGIAQISLNINSDNLLCSPYGCDDNHIINLVSNWKDNINIAFKILEEKWEFSLKSKNQITSHGLDRNKNIISNWFYPIQFYNGDNDNARKYAKNAFYRMDKNVDWMQNYFGTEYQKIKGFYENIMLNQNISPTEVLKHACKYSEINFKRKYSCESLSDDRISFGDDYDDRKKPLYFLFDMVSNNSPIYIWDQEKGSYSTIEVGKFSPEEYNIHKGAFGGAIFEEYSFNDGLTNIGEPFNDKVGKYVHKWGDAWIQNFKKNGEESAIISGEYNDKAIAFQVKGALWNWYRYNNGAEILGFPLSKEITKIVNKKTFAFQQFKQGTLLWDRESDNVSVCGFFDVPKGTWFYQPITQLCKLGIIQGKSGKNLGYFSHESNVKTVEFLKMIIELEDKDFNNNNTSSSWFQPYLDYANEIDLISDTEQKNIKSNPSIEITRGDACKYIVLISEKNERSYDSDESVNFMDLNNSNEYYDYVRKLSSEGIIKGYSDNTFKPENKLTRAEAAKIIYMNYDVNYQDH
jgi:hypothetical protein